jgi:hypothetical protein
MVISSNVGIDPPRLTSAYSFTLEGKGNARATVSCIDQDHDAAGDGARPRRIAHGAYSTASSPSLAKWPAAIGVELRPNAACSP